VRRRRIPYGILAPLALLLVAALLWTFVWFAAASRAREALAGWREAAAAQGARLSCAEESTGGYPFRLQFECASPEITFAVDGVDHALSGDRLRAVAQAYDTSHVIVELDAPARIARLGPGAGSASVAAGVIRASIEFADDRLWRLSAAVPGWTAGTGAAGPPAAGAGHSELHLRLRPEDDAVDVAVSAEQAHFSDGAADRRVTVDRARIVAVINRPRPLSLARARTWLSRWREAGGVADIRSLTFAGPSLAGEGAGTITLTGQDALEGALTMRLTRLDRFVHDLESRAVLSPTEADLLEGAAQLLATDVDGQKAATLPVRIRDGEVWLGPVKIWVLPGPG
jgi:hypothetical protein